MTLTKPYHYLKRYEIPLNGMSYGFWTLASGDSTVAWMPDNEQQHVNPQFRVDRKPVKLSDFSQLDIARVLAQILLFQTKVEVPLEDIVTRHTPLIIKMGEDLRSHQPVEILC